MERNEFNQIELYQLYYKGNLYCDWSTTCEILGMKSTNLFRLFTKLSNSTEMPVIKYKNRKYYLTDYLVKNFWKDVSEAQRAGKL